MIPSPCRRDGSYRPRSPHRHALRTQDILSYPFSSRLRLMAPEPGLYSCHRRAIWARCLRSESPITSDFPPTAPSNSTRPFIAAVPDTHRGKISVQMALAPDSLETLGPMGGFVPPSPRPPNA